MKHRSLSVGVYGDVRFASGERCDGELCVIGNGLGVQKFDFGTCHFGFRRSDAEAFDVGAFGSEGYREDLGSCLNGHG